MELNEVEKENLISLYSSNNDKDFQLAHKILMELDISEEGYLEIVRLSNEKKIKQNPDSKLWVLDQCKFYYNLEKKQKYGKETDSI